MAAPGGEWCLIESDPGVFTELIRGFGCTGLEVEELYSLDDDTFAQLRPVHGLIFLFKWRPGDAPSGTVTPSDNVFFAQQVIQNACATQAIVNMLMNVKHDDVTLGSILTDFREFTQHFQPADRGLALSNCDQLKSVHNSFARQTVFELDQAHATEKDDNYHFITYLPIDGHVYELDGLLGGPVKMARVEAGADWLEVVRPIINQRIQKYSEGEIHFNLMAVISDRQTKYEKQLNELMKSADTPERSEAQMQIQSQIDEHRERHERFRLENVRRRHNYVPFIVEMMRCLAKEGKLVGLVKQAEEKAKLRVEKEEKEKSAVKT